MRRNIVECLLFGEEQIASAQSVMERQSHHMRFPQGSHFAFKGQTTDC